jgi:hypothetical protein
MAMWDCAEAASKAAPWRGIFGQSHERIGFRNDRNTRIGRQLRTGWLPCMAGGGCCPALSVQADPLRGRVSARRRVDISARAIGQPLSAALGQSVVVDNKPGAAGNIATAFVAKANPDGYTLLMCNSTISTPSLFRNLPFDVRKDLDPVGLVAIGPSVLVVHPSIPARNVKELIVLAKAKPNGYTYGSGGIGNITHLKWN